MENTLPELVGVASLAIAVFGVGFAAARAASKIHLRLGELVGVAERILVELQDLHGTIEADAELAAGEGD